MKKVIGVITFIVIIFIAGMMTNYFRHEGSVAPSKTVAQKQKKILYWVAPMNPTFRRDKPGKSPMGMDLVPVYADGLPGDDQSVVKISPVVENNLGVKTAKVKRMDLSRVIDTVGYVTVDENNIEHIHTYTDGWVRVLNVKTTGELVSRNQLLMALYSPTLNNAQEEMLLALKSNNPSLIRAGEKKLITLGMAQNQVDQLRKSKRMMEQVKIYATQAGIVSKLNVREGQYVKPATDLMTIEDLSQIWIIAEVFERQAGWVSEGQAAIATLPYVPGKAWQGKVDYVYPELDPKTHTLRVRLTFPNPDLTIKPKMYADVKILSRTIQDAIAIPRAALIRTGEGDRVVIALGDGKFKTQDVKVGIESGDYYQMLMGLTKDDVVVTSAQFLIDSESNLKAGFSRLESREQTDQTKPESSTSAMPQEYVSMGKVIKLDHTKRIIVLDHQPIPALNMPAMTMELNVDKGVDLKNVKQGDEIHFVIVKQADKTYLLTKIHRMKMNKPSAQ